MINSEYIELFERLPVSIREQFRKGRYRISLTGLRRYSRMTYRKRLRVHAETRRLKCIDKAVEKVKNEVWERSIARRQREIGRAGKVPEFQYNAVPMPNSTDLRAFFIPPDEPEREDYVEQELIFDQPGTKKKKRFTEVRG